MVMLHPKMVKVKVPIIIMEKYPDNYSIITAII